MFTYIYNTSDIYIKTFEHVYVHIDRPVLSRDYNQRLHQLHLRWRGRGPIYPDEQNIISLYI